MVGVILNANFLAGAVIAFVYGAVVALVSRYVGRRRPDDQLTYAGKGIVRAR